MIMHSYCNSLYRHVSCTYSAVVHEVRKKHEKRGHVCHWRCDEITNTHGMGIPVLEVEARVHRGKVHIMVTIWAFHIRQTKPPI